ncbi:hypothetical protein PHISCL_04056 [Aspergillus sclerotialis]|uniref:Uncharacterized protein n=1 Tax=Aspergillus sclerotialis TaxID=2070753 RepID=A0A3A2ZLZ5_9EURO|nr:hypothetical protein PHISCL_04056 [Aspergillus sclerotialis]
MDRLEKESYINDEYKAFAKDKDLLKDGFQGYVLAVDANFDNSSTVSENADGMDNGDTQGESFKYPGGMHIQDNLVWRELYSMLTLQSVKLEDFWLQVREHSKKVYTGPTVRSQITPCKEYNALRALCSIIL